MEYCTYVQYCTTSSTVLPSLYSEYLYLLHIAVLEAIVTVTPRTHSRWSDCFGRDLPCLYANCGFGGTSSYGDGGATLRPGMERVGKPGYEARV
jgi:hypothetical protein